MNTLQELIDMSYGLRVHCVCNNTRDLDMAALLNRFGGDKQFKPSNFKCSLCGRACNGLHVYPIKAGKMA